MKRFLKVLFNIAWVIFCGIEIAITEIILGIVCCITIIGIPLGLQHFKFVKLAFAPAGKDIAIKYSRHPVMNTFYGLLGGWAAMIIYIAISFVLLITIIGIPLSLQILKFTIFNFAPYGSEVINEGEFTSKKDTYNDYLLLRGRINENPNQLLTIEGQELTTKDYINALLYSNDKEAIKWRSYSKKNILTSIFRKNSFSQTITL